MRSIEEILSRDKKLPVIYSKKKTYLKFLKMMKKINHTNYFTKLYNYLIGQLNNSDGLLFL